MIQTILSLMTQQTVLKRKDVERIETYKKFTEFMIESTELKRNKNIDKIGNLSLYILKTVHDFVVFRISPVIDRIIDIYQIT